MRTVLITGATGFLGSHLARAMVRDNRVIALKRSSSVLDRLCDISSDLVWHDVDRSDLETLFGSNQIDVVIHTATQYGRGTPVAEVVATNLLFPLRLLECANRPPCRVFVNADTFYPRYYDGYALAKKQFLEWLQQKPGTLSVVNLCLHHVYGEQDNPRKFLPWLIDRLLRHESVDLTPGGQKRDFVHVEDVVRAFVAGLDSAWREPKPYRGLEVGWGHAVGLREVVEMLKELCVSRSRVNFGAVAYREGEIMEAQADLGGWESPGWQPRVPLRDGLERTVRYQESCL